MIDSVRELEIPHEASPERDRVTVSIGVAAAKQVDNLPVDLVARADVGLYRAKESGRDRVMLDE